MKGDDPIILLHSEAVKTVRGIALSGVISLISLALWGAIAWTLMHFAGGLRP